MLNLNLSTRSSLLPILRIEVFVQKAVPFPKQRPPSIPNHMLAISSARISYFSLRSSRTRSLLNIIV